MEKKIHVGGRDVLFKATAATPMHYRNAFKGQDIFRDLMKVREAGSDDEIMESIDFGTFERIAYVMSEDMRNGVPFETWLESFDMMDIVSILPDIMELWDSNMTTQSIAPKNR